jgi:hypothetical protein
MFLGSKNSRKLKYCELLFSTPEICQLAFPQKCLMRILSHRLELTNLGITGVEVIGDNRIVLTGDFFNPFNILPFNRP